MMAVETVETHIEETGRLPYTDAPQVEEPSRMDRSDGDDENEESVMIVDRSEVVRPINSLYRVDRPLSWTN